MSDITTYDRPHHQSDETIKIIQYFAPWMQMTNQKSTGYQFINSLYGQYGEKTNGLIEGLKDNFHVDTGYENEPYRIYETIHNTASGSIPQDISITVPQETSKLHSIPSGTLGTTTWTMVVADDEEDFFNGYPTRLSWDPGKDKHNTTGDMTGLVFVRDWKKVDASGVVLIPKQDVYIVNRNLPTPVTSATKSTVVYDMDWNILDSYDYGLGYQDYTNAGYYERITDPSGYTLEYNPVEATIHVYDYINVDASGNAQVIPSGTNWSISGVVTDYITTSSMVMSGVNPYNLDEIGRSNYFIEYQYRKMDHPKCLTTTASKWHTQKFNSYPLFTSNPTNYHGTVIPLESAYSASGNLVYYRVDPRDLRPGSSGDLRFDYVDYIDSTWNNNYTISIDLSTVGTNYYDLSASGIHVYSNAGDITKEFPISATGNIVYVQNVSGIGDVLPYTIRSYYNARKTYSGIIAVQSFATMSGVTDPYPFDYMVEDDYLIPYSILPVTEPSDIVRTALLAATDDQILLTTQLLFTGIAYDKDKDCVWMLESNNMMLYKLRPGDGAVLEKYTIFKPPGFYFGGYKSTVEGRWDRYRNDTKEYKFISYEKDNSNRSGRGMVYYKDFLYLIASGTTQNVVHDQKEYGIGGYGIYRLNTYSNIMDIEYSNQVEKYPHYPLPISGNILDTTYNVCTQLVDITVDTSGNFRVIDGTAYRVLEPRYDYALVDSTGGMVRGTVYYIENYSGIIAVPGFAETTD